LWRDLPWAPPEVAPASVRVDYARQAITAARERGLRVYAQLAPYLLPGGAGGQEGTPGNTAVSGAYRPRRFIHNGPQRIIAHAGCLNNPTVRQLGRTRLRELLRHYDDVDGVVLDWVEYPVHVVDSLFTCFCDHC